MEQLLDIQTYNSYPDFSPNQVLTDNQLNDLRKYLDQQNRLTRVRTTGMGIICGLHASYLYTAEKKHEITLSEGYGITSDGFLAEVESAITYTHYRAYPGADLNDDSKDDYGWPAVSSSKTNQVWELISLDHQQKGTGKEEEEIQDFVINEHVLVLFVELAEEDLDPCVMTQCNNLGNNVSLNIKALMVPLALIGPEEEKLLKPVPVPSSPPTALHVPSLAAAVPLLWPGSAKGAVSTVLSDIDENECILTSLFPLNSDIPAETITAQTKLNNLNIAYACIIEHIGKEFLDNKEGGYYETGRLRGMYHAYGAFLDVVDDKYFEDVYECLQIQVSSKIDTDYTQYYYDYVRDLVCTYNEFIEAVCNLSRPCFLYDNFPRHLFISYFQEIDKAEEYAILTQRGDHVFRHSFFPSANKNVQSAGWKNAQKLFLRMMKMIGHFSEVIATDDYTALPSPILRLTPSQTNMHPLGKRAIPFYYDLSDDNARGSFKDYWQPKLHCSIHPTLNYYENGLTYEDPNPPEPPKTFPDPFIHQPLSFTRQKQSSLRIEGHIGSSAGDIFLQLEQFKKAHCLEFGIVVASLEDVAAHIPYPPDVEAGMENPRVIPVVTILELLELECGIVHTGEVTCGSTFVLITVGAQVQTVVADFSLCQFRNAVPTTQEAIREEGVQLRSAEEPQPISSGVQIQETKSQVQSVPSRTSASKSRARSASTPTKKVNLSGRRTEYLQSVMNLNLNNDFARNRSFQTVTDFLSSQPRSVKAASEGIQEIVAKTTALINRRTTPQPKRLAYQQMLEKSFQLYADTIVSKSPQSLPKGEIPTLQEAIKDMANAGINLKKLGQNWQNAELMKTAVAKQILNLLQSG